MDFNAKHAHYLPPAKLISCQHAPYSPPAGKRSWNFESQGLDTQLSPKEKFKLIPAGEIDFEKVRTFFLRNPPPGYDIGSVEIIFNPTLGYNFETRLDTLNERIDSPAFQRKWHKETTDAVLREEVYKTYKAMAAKHADEQYPHLKLLPMWHGTKAGVIDSICKTGFANLALTDSGYFGKGIYSAYEAEYSWRVYCQNGANDGVLILLWNACFSAYPVIDGDMEKLKGKGNYGNHDAHFIPVTPKDPTNPNEVSYIPCKKGQKATYHELVVFEQSHCLPRYVVRLQANMKKQMPLLLKAPQPAPGGKKPLLIAGAAPKKAVQPTKPVPAAPKKAAILATQSSSQAASLEERYQKAKDLLTKKAFEKAFDEFHALSNAGFKKAYFYKGYCYYHGLGIEPNYTKAIQYFQLACELNNATAYYYIGESLYHGKGCNKDVQKSYNYYIKAKELGDMNAESALKTLFKLNK